MAPKPPSPPAVAFEGNDACACRSSSERWPRMTNIPLLRTVLTRSPSEGRVILRRASGSSEPGHAIRPVSLDSVRAYGRDAFDRLLPPEPLTASTHVSCVPGFFSEAFASCSLERVGTLRSLSELALREEHRGAWGRSMQQGRGTVRFTTRGFASADRARARAGRYRHPRVQLDRASDISVASLASMRRATRGDMPARAAKIASAALHREVRSASTTRDAFPR